MRAFDSVAMNRVPRFIRDDYPALEEFLEAYFEFLQANQIDKGNFQNIRDIEKTFDEYLVYFKNTLAKGLPDSTAGDFRTIISHIREMFKAKGTEKSIKFFFKALFNENADIFYPRNQIFAASDSTWVRNRIIKVQNITGCECLREKELSFGTDGSLYVTDAFIQDDITVLSVSDIIGNIENVNSIFFGDIELPIVKQAIGFNVIESGSGFVPGAIYTDNVTGISVKVKALTRGRVETISVISGGTGYVGNEDVLFIQNGPLGKTQGNGGAAKINVVGGEIVSVDVLNGGNLYDLPPSIFVQSTSGTNAILQASGNFGNLKEVSIVNGGIINNLSPTTILIGDATLEIIKGNVAELEGSFYSSTGFPSSASSYLQDAHYYQYFSYVVRTGINVNQYIDIFKRLLHPAGMILFSQFVIDETVSVGTTIGDSKLIIKLFDFVESAADSSGSILNIVLKSFNQFQWLVRSDVDNEKFTWFDESTYINRFKDEKIVDFMSESIINPRFNEQTNFQPDAVVIVDLPK